MRRSLWDKPLCSSNISAGSVLLIDNFGSSCRSNSHLYRFTGLSRQDSGSVTCPVQLPRFSRRHREDVSSHRLNQLRNGIGFLELHHLVLRQHDFKVSTCLHHQCRGISSSCETPTRRTWRGPRRTREFLISFPGPYSLPARSAGLRWPFFTPLSVGIADQVMYCRFVPPGSKGCGPPSDRTTDRCSTDGCCAKLAARYKAD